MYSLYVKTAVRLNRRLTQPASFSGSRYITVSRFVRDWRRESTEIELTRRVLPLLALLGSLFAAQAHALPAVTLNYQLTSLGSDNYQLDYTLQNESAPGGINELILFFNGLDTPGADFPPLSISDPTGWTHTGEGAVIAPDPGHYAWSIDWVDADPNDPGVGEGSELDGFSVQFHWSDPEAPPGSQFFEAFGATPNEGLSAVPEPNSAALAACGFGLLAAVNAIRRVRARVGRPS
jgi:hypothetical protein